MKKTQRCVVDLGRLAQQHYVESSFSIRNNWGGLENCGTQSLDRTNKWRTRQPLVPSLKRSCCWFLTGKVRPCLFANSCHGLVILEVEPLYPTCNKNCQDEIMSEISKHSLVLRYQADECAGLNCSETVLRFIIFKQCCEAPLPHAPSLAPVPSLFNPPINKPGE